MTDYDLSWNETDKTVADLDIDVPEWVDCDITPPTVAAIVQGGCESGAYMPAVTYADALETMGEHGDDILDDIEDRAGALPDMPREPLSWSGLAVFYLSHAVELWARGVLDEIEEAISNAHDDELDLIAAEWPDIKKEIVEHYSEDDEPAINEGFNDWTDGLCKDGVISDWVYENVTREEIENR